MKIFAIAAIAATISAASFLAGVKSLSHVWIGSNTLAVTLNEPKVIEGDGEWHNTGFEYKIIKYLDKSTLEYKCQITFEQTMAVPTGNRFMMRVKDAEGVYIMPDMKTRQSTAAEGPGGGNAALIDTVYHGELKKNPLKGEYTFELWAMAGQGQITLIPYECNVVVEENPHLLKLTPDIVQ